MGTPFATLQEQYSTRVSKGAGKISLNPSQPFPFELLHSGWHHRALSTKTPRHKKSFFPHWAINMCNKLHYLYLFI